MGLYLYGICKGDQDFAEIIGLAEQPLFSISYQNLKLIVSKLETKEITSTETNYLLHAQVIEELNSKINILPISFGNMVTDKEIAYQLLEENHKDFRTKLNYLAGKVEVSLKVLWDGQDYDFNQQQLINEEGSNNLSEEEKAKKYLIKLKEKYSWENKAKKIINKIQQRLTPVVEEVKVEKLVTKNLLLKANYLISNDNLEFFQQYYSDLKERWTDLDFLYSGPWAPYNFVNLKIELETTTGGVSSGRKGKS